MHDGPICRPWGQDLYCNLVMCGMSRLGQGVKGWLNLQSSGMDDFTILPFRSPLRSSLSLFAPGKIMILPKDLRQVQEGPALHSLLRRDCETNE